MSQTTTPTYNSSGFLGSDPNVNRLYDNVQATLPGVTLPVVQMMAWNAVEDFYIRSTCERRIMNWQMAAGVQEIDLNPYDETWLVAWVLGYNGLHKSHVIPPATIRDLEYPANPRWGEVLLALKPINFNTNLPVNLFSNWFETILAGTLARLLMQPSKPWSSPQLAQYQGRMFARGIAEARAIADAEYTDGPGRWRFNYFANGRRKN
jgi:hypothetical protein